MGNMVLVRREERFKSGKGDGQNACWLDRQAAKVIVVDLVPFDTWGRNKALDLLETPD